MESLFQIGDDTIQEKQFPNSIVKYITSINPNLMQKSLDEDNVEQVTILPFM